LRIRIMRIIVPLAGRCTLPLSGKQARLQREKTIMAVTSISAALAALRKLSAENGNTPLEHTGGIVEGWEQMRTVEQLTAAEKREAHNVFAPLIADLFAADPDADLNPAEIAQRVGMPDKQGSRSFVRHQLKQLRLTYQGGAATTAAAD
jgi:hypothetical protein